MQDITQRLERVERCVLELQRKINDIESNGETTKQLAVIKQENAKMLAKMSNVIYSKIIDDVDAKLVPIKAAVAYNMEDAAGTIELYRRAVNIETKAISNGEVDRKNITKHMSVVFDEADHWDH